jgi:mRNA-degrading endonuclease YafQ of YafQ-DinJ toxin-antitoxin module
MPVEFDPQDGWQHADGSISHDDEFYGKSVSDLMEEQHGRTAGKGKPRRDAPDVARGADQADQGPARGLAPDSGRGGDGGESPAPLRALAEHPKVSRDLAKLPKNVKAAYHERVDGLRRGEPHSSTHALTGPLKGWQATSLNFQNRVVHRYDGDELHVLSAGNHDESYDQGARRLGRYTAPRARLFGPTFGLDTRLFDGEHLRPQVRVDVITRFDTFCHEHGYEGWHRWAKVVFFGSEASEWTSKKLVGNGDFDLSIGLHYQALRATVPSFAGLADDVIRAGFTEQMHAELNDPEHRFPGIEGIYDQTWFANLQGWDIARIKPYAAYDVVEGAWIVKPPELPDWSMADFPEGPGMEEAVRGIIELAEGYLKMPEPYRTQNGAALWEFVHSNRSDAFGPNGEGWWDSRNVVEKALDQKGLMQQLFDCHQRATEDPASLASPAGWSNSPVAAR